MLSFIKQKLPTPLKKTLISIKEKTYDNWQKRLLYKRMRLKHAKLLETLKGKKKIKVVFLAIHKSIWKVDTVFKRMQSDPLFEPVILICPYMVFGKERMRQDLKDTYEYFEEKGYPVISSYSTVEERWITLEELEPDIVFFTNPYKLTKSEYYERAYNNYLCCYVPYYFMATTHTGKLSSQLNTFMLNSMWRVYWPHQYIFDQFRKHSLTKGGNSLLTGYPASEPLLGVEQLREQRNQAWKSQTHKKKKLIYAPHHSIETEDFFLSTFLKYGDFIRQLSTSYKDEIQWSFKPHPILKDKLIHHPDWGLERTEEYYKYWESTSNTQLDLGGYDQLFLESDALIHDCSSFIAEYSFTQKPVLYLHRERSDVDSFLNEFGKKIFKGHRKAISRQDIINFISSIIDERETSTEKKGLFFATYLHQLYNDKMPSQKIVEDIKSKLN